MSMERLSALVEEFKRVYSELTEAEMFFVNIAIKTMSGAASAGEREAYSGLENNIISPEGSRGPRTKKRATTKAVRFLSSLTEDVRREVVQEVTGRDLQDF